MSRPKFWRVHWQQFANEPAGYLDFFERARARGFLMIRKASGFIAWIEPIGY